jgi:chemotaxis protein methyltransferase CheR
VAAAGAAVASSPGDIEFAFEDADFQRVRSMIRARAGIDLGPNKVSMVYSRLSRRLREIGMTDFTAYLDALARDARNDEWQQFVNALTTNLTAFFREAYHFPVLAEFLRGRAQPGRPLRVWCAASSTGEEPWSLAMTAIEALGESPPVRIFASDIDTRVLEQARRGVYPLAAVEALDPQRRRRFFPRGTGPNEGFARVRPELSRLVEFGRVNLVEDGWPMRERFDVVFCRNVMIYFDKSTQRAVLERLHRAVEPGGLLFVGHSENFSGNRDLFALRGKTVYERVDGIGPEAA